jgi:D-inositol-3-phosphate glycosyltransferase
MKYKNIAILSYHTCPLSDGEGGEIGGMNIYVLELCKQLARKGYKIDIFTRSQNKDSKKIVEVTSGLRIIHLIAGKEEVIEKKKLIKHIFEFTTNIFDFIEKNKINYNLIYAHYYLSGIAGLKVKERYKIPLFITFHTLALMKNLVARDNSEKEDLRRIESELLLVKKADKIISTSVQDGKYLETLYNCSGDKIFIITPGINLKIFYPQNKIKAKKIIGASENHKLILFVGRIEPLKAIDVLLYAMKILSKDKININLCLWILGGDTNIKSTKWSKELKRLDKLRQLLDISTEVTFIGKKHQDELPNYYNASEIVVLPSHYESFGIVALEAMSCCVPVITTDTAGIASLFADEDSPLITSANNPLMLAQKMKHLLTNKCEYQRISREVFKKAAELSWENIAEEFIKVIEN